MNQARKPPRNKQEFMRLARSLLRIRQRSKQLEHKDPPAALLEADLHGTESDLRLPTEFIYLLRLVGSRANNSRFHVEMTTINSL